MGGRNLTLIRYIKNNSNMTPSVSGQFLCIWLGFLCTQVFSGELLLDNGVKKKINFDPKAALESC